MFRKIVKHLTNNMGLKIASVLIAVSLWLVVVNYDNPEITRSYNVAITVLNPEIIENMGKVYDIVESSEVATFSVTGKRSYMDNISSANFEATADLSQTDFSLDNEIKYVPIEIKATKFENQLNITKKTVNMQIRIEDLSTEQFVISPMTQGEPAEGYAIGDKAVEPNLLKISGPQSVVSKINKVVANINVDGVSSDVSDRVIPILYDAADNVIESDQLRFSQESVTVSVKILGTKTVSIRCETSGTPAEGCRFTNLEYAPEQVTVKGEPGLLNSMVEIVIPGEYVDLEGATGDVENTIDITTLLEDGISLVDSEEGMIAVKAVIEKEETKTLDLPVGDIRVDNLSSDYKLEFVSEILNIKVQGLSREIEQLSVGQMQASIDVEGLKDGVRTVDVKLNIDEKYLTGPVTVQVRIIKKDTEENTMTNNSGGNENNSGGNENNSSQNEDETADAMTQPDSGGDTPEEEENNPPGTAE